MPLFSTARARPASFPLAVVMAGALTFPRAGHTQPLTLEEAMQIAEANQPLLAAQQAAVRAAGEASTAAAQLPDPKLNLGLLNVPVTGPDAFSLTQDFMTMRMIGVMQEFTRESKRRLKSELASIEGSQRQLELAFTRRMIRRDTTVAWLEAWYAERALDLVKALEQETERQIDALAIGLRAGKAAQTDVLAARVELDLFKDRADAQRQRAASARAELARWIGPAAARPLPSDPPALPTPPALDELAGRLQAHPHLSAYDRQVAYADKDAELARVATSPDWNIEVSYAVRGSAYSDMISVQVGIDLPVFPKNRQLRDVASKLALADRARAMREDNLREMEAMLRRAYAEWTALNERLARYRSSTLPQAQARTRAALATYRAGRGELRSVLEARRMELDLRMQQLMLEAEAARTQAMIGYYQDL